MSKIHIFRAGRHTAMQGQSLEFSEQDLLATAQAYDPAIHEAPLVIGHPKGNAPAYGWVSEISANAAGLFITPRQIDPAFAEQVREGRFKKVSASFYAPDSPHNPKPGVYYLRHVGFLGAQPPAVKGLEPFEFQDDGEGCITVEFAESAGLLRRLAEIFRGLREYILEKEGAETADRVLPGWTVDTIQEDAVITAASQAEIQAFSEQKPKEQIMSENPANLTPESKPENTPDFAEAGRKADALAKEVAELKAEARLIKAKALVDAHAARGALTHAQSAGLAEFMASLDESQCFDFAEADGKQVKIAPYAFMAAFLERLPKQVCFQEISRDFHEQIDGLTPVQAAQAALDYQEEARKAGRTVSITDALATVRAKGIKEDK